MIVNANYVVSPAEQVVYTLGVPRDEDYCVQIVYACGDAYQTIKYFEIH